VVVVVECRTLADAQRAVRQVSQWLRTRAFSSETSVVVIHLTAGYYTLWQEDPALQYVRHFAVSPAHAAPGPCEEEGVGGLGGVGGWVGGGGYISHFGAYVRQNIRLHACEPLLFPLLLPGKMSGAGSRCQYFYFCARIACFTSTNVQILTPACACWGQS
jgi:hypothetical protein